MFGGAPAASHATGMGQGPLWRLDTSMQPHATNQDDMATPTQASYSGQTPLSYRYEMGESPASGASANGVYMSSFGSQTVAMPTSQMGYQHVDSLAVERLYGQAPAQLSPAGHYFAQSFGQGYVQQYPLTEMHPRPLSPFGTTAYHDDVDMGSLTNFTAPLVVTEAMAQPDLLLAAAVPVAAATGAVNMPSPASSHASLSSSSKRFSSSSASSCSDSEHNVRGNDSDGVEEEADDRDGDFRLDDVDNKPKRNRSISSSASFSSSSSSRSSRKGSGVKRFACEFPGCDRAFARRFNLSTHVASTHYHSKPFACTECQKSFSRRHDLGRHLAAVHQTTLATAKDDDD